MSIKELVNAIKLKHTKGEGFYTANPATLELIHQLESIVGFQMPDDFRELYLLTNGFGCAEDLFNITSLEEIIKSPKDHGSNWFYFAEYLIFCDMWGLRKNYDGTFEIYNGSNNIILTHSLAEFLRRFLNGGVFEDGGLANWPG